MEKNLSCLCLILDLFFIIKIKREKSSPVTSVIKYSSCGTNIYCIMSLPKVCLLFTLYNVVRGLSFIFDPFSWGMVMYDNKFVL